MNAIKLVAVFGENKLGQMARITKVLAEAGINIRWVTIATSATFGVIKLLVDQSDLACQRLKKEGFIVSLIDVLAVSVEDRPGGLHAVVEVLATHRVNVENSSGFVSNHRAVLLIEVGDIDHARKILSEQKLVCLTQAEVMKL
jgi:hypothetical protein